MDKDTVAQVNDGQVQLLDVRTQEEWDSGHAQPAIHIPLQALEDNPLIGLATDKPVYVYCHSGNRAGQATKTLRDKGYEAYNVGGLSDWEAAGGKVMT